MWELKAKDNPETFACKSAFKNCFFFVFCSLFCVDLIAEKQKKIKSVPSTEFDKNISDWRYDCTDHKNGFDFFMRLVKWPKIAVKKCQNLIFKVNFQHQKSSESFRKKDSLKNINSGVHFLFSLILCSTKIEWLLLLKFLKILAFFDSYFWPFDKSEEKIKVIFVIGAIIPLIWNVFIKFRWHDEKLTAVTSSWFD